MTAIQDAVAAANAMLKTATANPNFHVNYSTAMRNYGSTAVYDTISNELFARAGQRNPLATSVNPQHNEIASSVLGSSSPQFSESGFPMWLLLGGGLVLAWMVLKR